VNEQLFGKYLLVEHLARGGMAEIYRAKIVGVGGFEKDVVIKRILPQFAAEHEFVKMIIDEAKIAGTLTHKNIVSILEFGKINESYFIAMEYVRGLDLGDLIHRGKKKSHPLSLENALYIIGEMAQGLSYAHEKKDGRNRPLNIIHRDISPQNILISLDGEVKLTDFGIAKATISNDRTQLGIVKGKFSYMSPEQVNYQHLDARSDIFSAGIVCWEILTGRLLFPGDDPVDIVQAIKSGAIKSPSSVNLELPATIDPIILKALERNKDKRYQAAIELYDAISEFASESSLLLNSSDLSSYVHELFADDASLGKTKSDGASIEDLIMSEIRKFSSVSNNSINFLKTQSEDKEPPPSISVSDFVASDSQPSEITTAPPSIEQAVGPQRPGMPTLAIHTSIPANGPQGRRPAVASPRPMRSTLPAEKAQLKKPTIPLVTLAAILLSVSYWLFKPDLDHSPTKAESQAKSTTRQNGLRDQSVDQSLTDATSTSVSTTPRRLPVSPPPDPQPPAIAPQKTERSTVPIAKPIEPAVNPRKLKKTKRLATTSSRRSDPTGKRNSAIKEFGYLSLNALPWAKVKINGREIKTTPLLSYRLPPGDHVVELYHPGLRTRKILNISLAKNQRIERVVDMNQ